MEFKELVNDRRTVRKFTNDQVEIENIIDLVDLARMAPSGSNMQPLKYVIVHKKKNVNELFTYTKWAGYLQGKGRPDDKHQPGAYIIVLNDRTIRKEGYELDAGAAIMNILLGACDKKMDAAWLGAIDRDAIRKLLLIPDQYVIISAIALGYGDYKTITEDEKGDIKYYLDSDEMLHIPKRKLKDLIVLTK